MFQKSEPDSIKRRCDRSLVALALLVGFSHAFAVGTRTGHSSAELVAEQSTAMPDQPFRVALRLQHDDGWHSYWINPGDSGLATSLRWDLPEGWRAGDITWPAPHRFEVGGIANYGYSDEVLLPVQIIPAASAKPGETATLRVDARWLACSDICVTERATLELAVRMAKHAVQPGDATLWARLDAAMPVASRVDRGQIDATADGFSFRLEGLPTALPAGTPVEIYPRSARWLQHDPLHAVIADDRSLQFSAARNTYFSSWPEQPILLLRGPHHASPAVELSLELSPPVLQGDTP